jgi:hypothetical protein
VPFRARHPLVAVHSEGLAVPLLGGRGSPPRRLGRWATPPFGRTDGRTDGRISEPPRRRVYPSMGGRGVLIPPSAPLYIVEWAPFYIIKRAKGGSFPIFYKKRVSASLPEHPFSLLGYPAKGLPPHLWVFIRRRAHRRCHNPPVPFGQRGRDVGDGGERISAFYGGSSASTESMPRSASGEVLCSEVASPWTTSRDPPPSDGVHRGRTPVPPTKCPTEDK